MFERFTNLSRQSLVLAQVEARELGHDWLGTEHQLLGLLRLGEGVAYRVLTDAGVAPDAVRSAVADAVGGPAIDGSVLATIGIDLDEVRRQAEEAFGAGALDDAMRPRRRRGWGSTPFTPRAKHVLELSLREAVALRHHHIGTEHILLGMLREGEGLACQVLRRLAPDADLRAAVLEQLRAA